MINFLQETIKEIKNSNHTENDVMFVGSVDGKYRIDFEQFSVIANREYDNGYGGAEIDHNLIVYFNDCSFLRRGEYDGSEWWEYETPKIFTPNDKFEKLEILFNEDLEED